MTDHHDVRRGQTAYDSEGKRLGRVIQCDQTGFFIEKGFVFPEDYRVEYDEVLAVEADEVRLRFPASALVPEEEADSWDPARDPVGTSSGTDLEPLRAGMAEIDEKQGRASSSSAGDGEKPPARHGARAWREAQARSDGSAEAAHRQLARPSARRPERAPAVSDGEVEKRIDEEVEDFERGAGCGRRSDVLLQREAEVRASASASASQEPASGEGTRAGPPAAHEGGHPLPAAPSPHAAAPSPAKSPSPARRLDYREAAPGALAAMMALERYVRGCGLERPLLELVRLRASQLNGCAYCVDMHSQDARHGGEAEQRLYALSVWKETPFFTSRERAALAWTEAVTRLGADHVGDETYQLAREEFGESELVNLTLAVIAINGWNRLGVAFRSEPGSYRPGGS